MTSQSRVQCFTTAPLRDSKLISTELLFLQVSTPYRSTVDTMTISRVVSWSIVLVNEFFSGRLASMGKMVAGYNSTSVNFRKGLMLPEGFAFYIFILFHFIYLFIYLFILRVACVNL